jgi:hypothetical protein
MTIVESERDGRALGSTDCPHCGWGAIHRGEDVIEVRSFLRGLLLRHLAERHPEILGLPQ